MPTTRGLETSRVAWVDYAKGLCIIMVVMMHSTLGVELAVERQGFMHYVVEFARPFRMPDFFLISGLFVSQVIDRPWRLYLDRKVVHFAYFYVLWTAIQFVFKTPGIASDHGWHYVGLMYLQSFIEPFGTLWFIYLLPIFFLVTRITRQLPSTLIWIIAAALEMAHVSTGWTVIDEFASRFFFFYAGFRCAPTIFAVAANAEAHPRFATGGLIVWAAVNGAVVASDTAGMPGISLALGLAGALAIVVSGVLLARIGQLGALRFAGQQSIIVYLAFFLPMAFTRTVLIKSGLIASVGLMSIIVTTIGVLVPFAMWQVAIRTGLHFLFERPKRFWLPSTPRMADKHAAA
ncbi:acyltransferase family protein [Bradyrhizobium sp. 139]|uniref:acyltransferase family protein n=1 Tax=Bradyrhizobium sp. 139 TaxID=2782616 RepID=UPI001FFB2F97|nr:acyltransferase family protein [Bradyrhizobium sp. 139]MCK1744814.1 acyltransferase family protein [Bradyrhizobium sp. 139]